MSSVSDRLVYGLIDPVTQQLRYVGLTTRGAVRIAYHQRWSKRDDRTRRASWIRSLRRRGLAPDWCVLEQCDTDEQLGAAERYWISYYRRRGFDLTNLKDGGFGGRHSPATIRKISPVLFADLGSRRAYMAWCARQYRARVGAIHKVVITGVVSV